MYFTAAMNRTKHSMFVVVLHTGTTRKCSQYRYDIVNVSAQTTTKRNKQRFFPHKQPPNATNNLYHHRIHISSPKGGAGKEITETGTNRNYYYYYYYRHRINTNQICSSIGYDTVVTILVTTRVWLL